MMAILNYTTTVDAYKTVSEIEYILVKHKAKSIMKNYDGETITGLSFLIDTGTQQLPVILPVKIDECLEDGKTIYQRLEEKQFLLDG
ncbi:hypothetical protein AALA79_01825 [Lachnospiraceae bacterium 64-25]